MEKRPVKLTLTSRQTCGEDTERVEQTLEGTLTATEKGWQISYAEREESGMGKTQTTLTAMGEKVILDRKGETDCRLVFRAGRRTFADYRTLYGQFPVEIVTRDTETLLVEGESGIEGRIFLDYDLALGGDIPTRTVLELKIV